MTNIVGTVLVLMAVNTQTNFQNTAEKSMPLEPGRTLVTVRQVPVSVSVTYVIGAKTEDGPRAIGGFTQQIPWAQWLQRDIGHSAAPKAQDKPKAPEKETEKTEAVAPEPRKEEKPDGKDN